MNSLIKDFQISCSNCKLDTICLPRGLSKQEVEDLSVVVKNNAALQKGDYIYRQGDVFSRLVAIKSGSAKLVNYDTDGNEHILKVLLPGELVGFDGLFQDKYNCSAIALEKMSFCELSADKIDVVCSQIPGITRELFKHSSEAINEFQNQVVVNKSSADKKLAMFLISLSDRLKKRGFSSIEFNIPLTRQEMGDHLGLTFETVSRTLQHLQDKGFIRVQRKFIEIKDLSGLMNVF